ncbi:hypothetical protein [Massilia suwonensis]|uniref:Integron gene cassette protein n=1 Tax=Massilia suwonensis TaxID=648895 RepID=A0ABW0MQY5_9BURK
MTEQFDKHRWHDNAIHGFRIVEGEHGCGELDLDIDFINEWLPSRDVEHGFLFGVSPSNPVFHEVSDLVISIDYAACSAALQPMAILEIHRKEHVYPNGYQSFAWKIEMAWPANSFLSFCSPGFTQTPRAEPVYSPDQSLAPSQRSG